LRGHDERANLGGMLDVQRNTVGDQESARAAQSLAGEQGDLTPDALARTLNSNDATGGRTSATVTYLSVAAQVVGVELSDRTLIPPTRAS
jgi:hypothetical protein